MISDSIQINGVSGSAVNYRSEPWRFRYTNNNTPDFSCMLSNQLVIAADSHAGGRSKTPIFGANAWRPGAIPHDASIWNRDIAGLFASTVTFGSAIRTSTARTKLGNNNLSQWIGSRDNHGSSDHFDMLIDKGRW